VPWSSLRWLVQAIEAAAVIVFLLSLGAAIAVAAFWLLARFAAILSGPQPQDPNEYETADQREDPHLQPHESKHPPSPC
jgi:hypothetical protein